ncbi:MAG: CRISPR-associated protein Cas4 [Proteobacteria bacterium]|nr:CRISPR-associated protein Cas4 [Pseudomonadota bacterium]
MENSNSISLSITTSQLMEYVFCPRFTYFEYVLNIPQNEGNRFKVEKGRTVHEIVRKQNPDYLRKKLGVIDKKSDVYLSSSSGIRGIVDEILFLEDGSASPLDYKYAEYKGKIFKTYRYQLIFYAKLIKDNYDVSVNKGFVVYTRSKNKMIELEIKEKDFDELEKIIGGINEVICGNHYPGPTSVKRRCPDCCYKNICESVI